MTEIVFWILVSFFSAVGVVETVSFLKKSLFNKQFPPAFVIIPQKDDAISVETQVRYVLSQIRIPSRVVIVDTGLNEEGRELIANLEKQLPITLVRAFDILEILT